ncbi:hypothetical protein DI392_13215 [Vibrio albus]|jgi:hypothetical protein|uniref:Uncharacterized protein n=9 Tax=Vibrionaceae TaxID=641 RepID=A0A0C3HTX7_9VIBR|nr:MULTISPECIES: hypothetical protein [Vibrionaceae]EKO3796645.1 hypothetical protein [Vibrio metschnikovii]MBY8081971.1 hypothetical protein [Vibrio fluvialis]MDW1968548.1 hypothetical protein [Vibrio sp. 945]QLK49873.1 hypothetical protein DR996_33360 [Vibrio owensii]AKD43606.1 hypothetical protein [Vibrio parahaemolyticus]
MSKFDQIATVHKLTVVKQADEHDSEFDVYLCEDQFGNEWALSKEGEPEYAEWGVYNYIVRNNVCMITTPVSTPCMSWELADLPKDYKGELQVGMSIV